MSPRVDWLLNVRKGVAQDHARCAPGPERDDRAAVLAGLDHSLWLAGYAPTVPESRP